jgi:hypothetical protein
MTHTGSRDNPLRFWVEEFHLAFTMREFGEGKGDHNSWATSIGQLGFFVRS